MEQATAINALSAVLLALVAWMMREAWREVLVVRKRTHRHAQFLIRHEGRLVEISERMDMPPMPPIMEES